jgi:hypothetical protein
MGDSENGLKVNSSYIPAVANALQVEEEEIKLLSSIHENFSGNHGFSNFMKYSERKGYTI